MVRLVSKCGPGEVLEGNGKQATRWQDNGALPARENHRVLKAGGAKEPVGENEPCEDATTYWNMR